MKPIRMLGLAAVAAAAGACAPQFHLTRGPGLCSPMERAAHHRTSIMATTQKVQRLQARYSLSARYVAANPANWRTHPGSQRDALRGSLTEVGWVAEVIVNTVTGHLVDGHLRVEQARARGEPTGGNAAGRSGQRRYVGGLQDWSV